ncbi:hypothetical protein ACQFYA_05200 [Promicromonospora sp. Marseille-Q5078]
MAWIIEQETGGPALVVRPGEGDSEAVAEAVDALSSAATSLKPAVPGWYRQVHRAPWLVYVAWGAVVLVVMLLVQDDPVIVNVLISAALAGLVLGVITLPLLTRAARGGSRFRAVRAQYEATQRAVLDVVRVTPDDTGRWAAGVVADQPTRVGEVHDLLWTASSTTHTEATRESRTAAARLYTLWQSTPEARHEAGA